MKKIKQKNNKAEIVSHQSGFTLIETVVTTFIFGIIMLGSTLMVRDIFVNSEQEYSVLSNIGQVRIASNNFVNELRNGSYGANGSYPINQAGDNQLIFFSTAPKKNGTVSQIRYFLTGNTLSEGITNPAGSPPSYVGQPETIKVITTKMSLGANPLFTYYDSSYTGTGSPLTQPVNINQVKFIKINLTVLKEIVRNASTTFTVSAGATIRNLKTNLGN